MKKTFACVPVGSHYLTQEELDDPDYKCLSDLPESEWNQAEPCTHMDNSVKKEDCEYWQEVFVDRRINSRRKDDN